MLKLLAIPATVIALLAGSTGTAQAYDADFVETSICGLLDTMPTDAGVVMVVEAGAAGVAQGNYTTDQFAQMVVEAVTVVCPEYYGLVMRSADRHTPKPVFVA